MIWFWPKCARHASPVFYGVVSSPRLRVLAWAVGAAGPRTPRFSSGVQRLVELQSETAKINPDEVRGPAMSGNGRHRFGQCAGRDDLASTERLACRISGKFFHKKAEGRQRAAEDVPCMAKPREAIVADELHAEARQRLAPIGARF
jgi:hypothetical protein